jgi:hypothetical protein
MEAPRLGRSSFARQKRKEFRGEFEPQLLQTITNLLPSCAHRCGVMTPTTALSLHAYNPPVMDRAANLARIGIDYGNDLTRSFANDDLFTYFQRKRSSVRVGCIENRPIDIPNFKVRVRFHHVEIITCLSGVAESGARPDTVAEYLQ